MTVPCGMDLLDTLELWGNIFTFEGEHVGFLQKQSNKVRLCVCRLLMCSKSGDTEQSNTKTRAKGVGWGGVEEQDERVESLEKMWGEFLCPQLICLCPFRDLFLFSVSKYC